MDWLLNRLVVSNHLSETEADATPADAETADDSSETVGWDDISETADFESTRGGSEPPPVTSEPTSRSATPTEAADVVFDSAVALGSDAAPTVEAAVPDLGEPETTVGTAVDHSTDSEELDTGVLLGNLLGGLDSPTILFSTAGRVQKLNRAAAELFGISEAEAVGRPVSALHEGSNLATQVVSTGDRISDHEETITVGRTDATLSRTVIPFADEAGAVVGGMEIATDITELVAEREKTEQLTAYQDTVIATLRETVGGLARGDLTVDPTIPEPDTDFEELWEVYEEFAAFGAGLSTAVENYRTVLSRLTLLADDLDDTSQELSANSEEVTASVAEISHSTEEIAGGTQDLAERTDEADLAVSSLTATIEEITASAEEIDAETSEASQRALEAVKDGSAAVDRMETVTDATDEIASEVETLEQKMEEVGSILDVIFSIADQTNLLALNATIEAARAGEDGAGFAVVADEVKSLAEKSKQSANEIESIITAAEDQTSTVSDRIDTTTDQVADGAAAVERVIDKLAAIESGIEGTSAATAEVSQAVESQAHNMDDLGATIEHSASLSEELSASLQEISAGLSQQSTATDRVAERATSLSATSEDLYDRIEGFRLHKDESADVDID